MQTLLMFSINISIFQSRLEQTFSFFCRHSLQAPRLRVSATRRFDSGVRERFFFFNGVFSIGLLLEFKEAGVGGPGAARRSCGVSLTRFIGIEGL
jgi:hypothetical protein